MESNMHLPRVAALTLAFLTFSSFSSSAQQPWWCGKPASNCTESVICATPQLARFDVKMSTLYRELKGYSSRRSANRLLRSQRQWLRERNSCGCNADCLISYYRSRINLFTNIIRPDAASASDAAYNYACVGRNMETRRRGQERRYAVKVVEDLNSDGRLKSGAMLIMAKSIGATNDRLRLRKGETVKLRLSRVSDKCAKYGWEAESPRYYAVMCTATQGVADIELFSKSSQRVIFRAECESANVN
jgi:uncharacterized protein